jgi:hypothetical protein
VAESESRPGRSRQPRGRLHADGSVNRGHLGTRSEPVTITPARGSFSGSRARVRRITQADSTLLAPQRERLCWSDGAERLCARQSWQWARDEKPAARPGDEPRPAIRSIHARCPWRSRCSRHRTINRDQHKARRDRSVGAHRAPQILGRL